jgi:photosystem II stability/assembly factor-like uncharacterized protein
MVYRIRTRTTNSLWEEDLVDTALGTGTPPSCILPMDPGTGEHSAMYRVFMECTFVDSTHGWMVGTAGSIYHTTDDGASWNLQQSGTSRDLRSVFFTDQNHGVVVGDTSTLLLTTDGGASWTPRSPGAPDIPLKSVKFMSDSIGVAVGTTAIVKTTDGGFTWVVKRPLTDSLNDVSFTDLYHGLAIGTYNGSGLIMQTWDGGENWFPYSGEIAGKLTGVAFLSRNLATVVGYDDNGQPVILRTVDGGTTWWNQSPAPTQSTQVFLYAVSFLDPNKGFAVGRYSIDYTNDGGGPFLLPGINLAYPSDNSTHSITDVTLGWRSATVYPCTYHIQYSISSNFPSNSWTFDTVGITDTMGHISSILYGSTYYWRVKVNATIEGVPAESPWSGSRSFKVDPAPVQVHQIQEVSHDSLLVADSLQEIDTTRWSVFTGTNQCVPARCVIPPLVLTKNRYTMVVYDTTSNQQTWRGVMVECDPYGPLSDFLNVRTGDVLYLPGIVEEIPWPTANSETRLKCLSVSRTGSNPAPIAPVNVSIPDFYVGAYPTGQIRFSTGEQYEGMFVEMHHLRSSSIIDTTNGTFMLVDSAGNTFSVADLSKWFTLGSHRDTSSTYSIPVDAYIDTIRGIITDVTGTPGPNGGYGYCIAPVYPGDIVYGGSSRSRISGTIFNDENQDSVRNSGEPGLGGWRVLLSGKSASATMTDNQGRYSFTGIDSGTYTISVQPPPGYDLTFPQAGSYTVNLGIIDNMSGKDFGYHYRWNLILGSVYEDRNKNGVRDDFEKGLSHWLVRMTGAITDSTYTDSSGNYGFTLVSHNGVTITVVSQSPWEQIWPLFNGGYDMFFTHDTSGVVHLDFGMEKTPVRIKLTLTVRDNTTSDVRILSWGNRPGATFGIWGVDPACTRFDFAEQELPVPPLINGYFDARFINPNLTGDQFEYGSWTDMRGFASPAQVDTHAIMFEPGSISGGDFPMRFYWSKQDVQTSFSGPVTLQYPGGATIDMKTADSLIISNPQSWYVRIISIGPNLPPQDVPTWRMISLPVESGIKRAPDLFPTSISAAFSYSGSIGYSVDDTLNPGIGYWLRMIYALDSGQVEGTPVMNDTIGIALGWNLIGSIGVPISINDIEPIGGTVLSNHIFGYGQGYYVTDSLRPYNAYWVKSTEAGKIVLSGTPSPRSGKSGKVHAPLVDLDTMNLLTLTDADGFSRKLYCAAARDASSLEEMMVEVPPLPPEGLFDARYGTNRMVEGVTTGGSKEVPIRLSSARYPVTVEWLIKKPSMTMSLLIGTKEHKLSGKGSVQIGTADDVVKLRMSGSPLLPKEYALYQNFPNPFNPVTTIGYELPVESKVRVTIYNILGEVTAVVVDGVEAAGYKQVTWNAMNLASGVYFYKLDASGTTQQMKSFTKVYKMLLLK